MTTMRKATMLIALLASVLSSSTSQAGMFDWLFPPKVSVPTVATYYPPQVVATQTRQWVVSYRPQVRYRTSWARVPVTVYRPVSNLDPASGCTTSCMRPCTTYEWQRRRVPVTTLRPRYSLVQGPCQIVQQPIVSSGCAGCGIDSGISTSTTTTAPANGSYYDYPAGVNPSSTEPADNRPRLRGAPPATTGQGTSVLRPADPLSGFRRNPTQPLAPVIRRATPQPIVRQPAVAPRNPTTAHRTPTTVQRQQLKPIPDPERNRKTVVPPALIKPAGRAQLGRTVQLPTRQSWASAPIEWAMPVRVRPASAVTKAVQAEPTAADYDDSGWTALAR